MHFFNAELTVKQLLDLERDSQALVGEMVNSLWKQRTGFHHPAYFSLEVERYGPDHCLNGRGQRGCAASTSVSSGMADLGEARAGPSPMKRRQHAA
jgi:hypothetical protein